MGRQSLERAREGRPRQRHHLGRRRECCPAIPEGRLIDEMEIHVVPVLLGDGVRLFDNADGRQTSYQCVRVINSPSVSHYKYRLRR